MATHSSILVWKTLWTEETGALQSMGSQRVGHNKTTNTTTMIVDLGFPGGSAVKNPPAVQKPQEAWVQSLGQEDFLEGRTWQPVPVFLPGESPWTEEPGGLQFMGLQRVGHDKQLSTQCSLF